jgi:multidrug efflux pump subunit AcrA (membrane-fusion protein)
MSVQTGDPQTVIAVPRRAVLGSLGKMFVFVENEPGTYERREVVTGLKSGDRVVIVGNYQLQYVLPQSGGTIDAGHGHAH